MIDDYGNLYDYTNKVMTLRYKRTFLDKFDDWVLRKMGYKFKTEEDLYKEGWTIIDERGRYE